MRYFLFRKEEVNNASTTSSDTGVGMSIMAIPSDSVAYLSAEPGKILIVFNDATLYQDVMLLDGESLEKSNVTIACEIGNELKLVEEIVSFMAGESRKNIMRFDVVEDSSTFKNADVATADNISVVVRTRPINMQTKKVSNGRSDTYDPVTDTYVTASTIANIDFGDVRPFVDYNPSTLSTYANGDTITLWKNSGEGGSSYDLTPYSGTTPSMVTAANQNNFSTDAVSVLVDEFFETSVDIKVKADYTIYVVYGTDGVDRTGPIYGDSDGETAGFAGEYDSNGELTSVSQTKRGFSIRHSNRTGTVASSLSSRNFIGDGGNRPDGYNPCNVSIIRRDAKNNIYLHDRTGEVIAQIAAKATGSSTTPGATDGSLLINRVGTTNEITSNAFKGNIARFGVIKSDIGTNNAAKLAKDLFDLYTL